jgi:hypothetical protein
MEGFTSGKALPDPARKPTAPGTVFPGGRKGGRKVIQPIRAWEQLRWRWSKDKKRMEADHVVQQDALDALAALRNPQRTSDPRHTEIIERPDPVPATRTLGWNPASNSEGGKESSPDRIREGCL